MDARTAQYRESERGIDKCLSTATMLVANLRDAHSTAREGNEPGQRFLEILLLDLIGKAAEIKNNLTNINDAYKGGN